MKKVIGMALMVSLGTMFASAWAYAGEAIPKNPTRENVIELLEISNSYELTLQVMGAAMNSVRNGYNERLPNNNKIPEEVWAGIVNDAKDEMDQKSYYDMVVPIYIKHLTAEDIGGIIAFYRSEAGRKLIRVMPDIARDSMEAGQEWAKKTLHRIIPRIEKRLKEMGYPEKPIG